MRTMTNPFLIVGLPRSRTAWLSVVTTTDRAFCFHEPVGKLDRLADLVGLWQSNYYRHVGVADSLLGFHLGWLLGTVKPRTLIVDRDLADVEASLAKLGGQATNYCELLREELDRWRHHSLVMSVRFEDLSDVETMLRVWGHLMPAEPFNVERFEQLTHMNVQVEPDHMRRQVNSPAVIEALAPIRGRLTYKEGA